MVKFPRHHARGAFCDAKLSEAPDFRKIAIVAHTQVAIFAARQHERSAMQCRCPDARPLLRKWNNPTLFFTATTLRLDGPPQVRGKTIRMPAPDISVQPQAILSPLPDPPSLASMTESARLKIKIQIHSGDEIAMGPGKADLLDAIREHGSISAAGRAMGMSYRRAWLLVDVMNRCWHAPLVHTAPGRAATSGARLTETGETVLRHYRALQDTIATASRDADYDALAACLLASPRLSQKAPEAVASPPPGD